MMRSGNPVLKNSTFQQPLQGVEERMTLPGTVNKTAMLLAMTLITAAYTWGRFMEAQDAPAIQGLMLLGIVGGLALGGISSVLEARFPGIVIQAVGLTLGTLFCLLAAYRSGLIKPTENFKLGIVAATGGILVLYLVSFVMSFFGNSIGFIHNSGPIGIAFSGFVVVIAALNLVLDFDFIESGVDQGVPKYMEWYGAFGLLVTLLWLYLEILRLLAKLRE